MRSLTEGQQLSDRFTLVRALGRGGMGEVWLATDRELGKNVALKILSADLSDSPGMVTLLKQEYRNCRSLSHPAIVRAHDFHDVDGLRFFSMEYVEGNDLREHVGGDYRKFLPLLLPVADALATAHEAGLVHRDIKPANILIDRDGRPRLTDFGIASALNNQRDGLLIKSGGSVPYMSPQQLSRSDPAAADDVYSFGAVLYELLAGAPPSADEIENLHRDPPANLSDDETAPESLTRLALSMLATEPEKRPLSMRLVHGHLRGILLEEFEGTLPPDIAEVAGSSRAEYERIAPVALDVPEDTLQSLQRSARKSVPVVPVAIAMVWLIIIAVAAFLFLPDIMESIRSDTVPEQRLQPEAAADQDAPSSTATTGPVTAGTPGSPYEAALLKREREAAEEILDELIRLQFTLEDTAVDRWSPIEYATAREEAETGDRLFREQKFEEAKASYKSSLKRFQSLMDGFDAALDAVIAEGLAAIDDKDATTATEKFELAVAMKKDDRRATRGLVRAQNLNSVLAKMADGRKHEREGDLEAARTAYTEARDLDPDYAEAQAAAERVRTRIVDDRFAGVMSRAFEALHREDYRGARESFLAARKMRPDSAEVRDGLAQVEFALGDNAIARHREAARAHENSEQWHEAVTEYDALLKLDGTLVFAREGRQRAADRAQLADRLDEIVDKPERLQDDTVFNGAVSLYYEVSAMENRGPKLETQLKALATAMKNAESPVRVRLESDNKTDVVLYKVGRLGNFESHELELKPGTYTIVGTRPGFRDVRNVFTIVPGEPAPPVVIRCEEKI